MSKSLLAIAAALLSAGADHASSVRDIRYNRRLLIIAAPAAADASLLSQRAMLADWKRGASDRDISKVELVGDHVAGADDSATKLRRLYDLPVRSFEMLLIGKDGHVAFRTSRPVAARTLEAVIDAMPMRRAGQR